MRNLVILAVLAIGAGGAYLYSTGAFAPEEPAPEPVVVAPAPEPEPTPEPAPEPEPELTAVTDAVEDAVEDLRAVSEEAADAVEGALANVTEDAGALIETVTAAAQEAGGLDQLLNAETFDFDAAADMVANSDLGLVAKAGLSAALEQAKESPELLEAVIAQLREQLGS
ncbi:MAG: hypothetical protein AAF092_03345 [Pseudomonadota bacterium]